MTGFDSNFLLKEKVDVLDGSRTNQKLKAAVRLEDLSPLLQLPEKLQAKQVKHTISTNDFNALVDDVTKIHRVLTDLATVLQARNLP